VLTHFNISRTRRTLPLGNRLAVGFAGLAYTAAYALLVLYIGGASSQGQDQRGTTIIRGDAGTAIANGNYYALVIGIDDYPPPLPRLQTAVADVRAVSSVLNERYGFQVQLLLDREATRAHILDAITRYRNTLSANDSLLIYYAGHGYSDHEADKAYWLPADADSSFSANRIIADDLTTGVRVLPARHVLVISDSCYSGGLTRDADAPVRSGGQEAFINRMLRSRSRTLMASGGDEPVSDAGTDGHSVFAYAVLRALERTDGQMFTASDMFYGSVRRQVASKSEQLPRYSIIRNSNDDEGDFVFSRKTVSGATPHPSQTETVATTSETTMNHLPKPAQSNLVWIDPSSGLMWARRDNGSPVTPYQAASYCQSLQWAGYADWRLPTTEELQGIYDPASEVPCIGLTCHINANLPPSASSMWSSTIATPAGSVALVSFLNGRVLVPGNQFINARALCVRRPGTS
jgi:hypothetical protein